MKTTRTVKKLKKVKKSKKDKKAAVEEKEHADPHAAAKEQQQQNARELAKLLSSLEQDISQSEAEMAE